MKIIKLGSIFVMLFPHIGWALTCVSAVTSQDRGDAVITRSAVQPACSSVDLAISVEHTFSELDDAQTPWLSLEADSSPANTSDYWSEWWNLEEDTQPILTENFAFSYFGIGLWLPEEVAEQERKMSTDEWILNHGLKFSLGLGEKQTGKPRMRFDYRWHNEYDGDVMMQVEVPF